MEFIKDILKKEKVSKDESIIELNTIAENLNVLCSQAEKHNTNTFFKESMGETFSNFKELLKKIMTYIVKLYTSLKNLLMKIFGINIGSSGGGGGFGGGGGGVGVTDEPVPTDVNGAVNRLNDTHHTTNINNTTNNIHNVYNVRVDDDTLTDINHTNNRVQMERFIADIGRCTSGPSRDFIKGIVTKYRDLIRYIINSDKTAFNNMLANSIRDTRPTIAIPIHAYMSINDMYPGYFIEDILPAIIPADDDEAKRNSLDSIRANSRFTRRFVDDMNATSPKFRGEFTVDRYNIARVNDLNITLNIDDVETREVNVDMNLLDGLDSGRDIMENLIVRYYSRNGVDISIKNVMDTMDNQIKDLESRISIIDNTSTFSELVYTKEEIIHAIKAVVYSKQLDFWCMTYLNTTTKSDVVGMTELMIFRYLLAYATEYKVRFEI